MEGNVMKNLISVKKLRADFNSRQSSVEVRPGVYRWWFSIEQAQRLLELFSVAINADGIMKRVIEGDEYWALYFGISSDLRKRIRWHVNGPFKSSTLRRTLRALLQPAPADEDKMVNDFLDQCFWEWDYTDSVEEAEGVEKAELSRETHWYPLNIKENRSPLLPANWTNELKSKRNINH